MTWTTKSGNLFGGKPFETWIERAVPGSPGTFERRMISCESAYRLAPERPQLVTGGTTGVTSPGPHLRAVPSAPQLTPKPSTRKSIAEIEEEILRQSYMGRVRVFITASAYRGFFARQQAAGRFQHLDGTVELGGGLFGTFRNERFAIEDVTGRVRDEYAERNSGRLDLEFIERCEARHRRMGTGHILLGFWHGHPALRGGHGERVRVAVPSRSDLRVLEAAYERSQNYTTASGRFKAPCLGVVLGPRWNSEYGGWARPIATGYIARGSGAYPEVEFASVDVEGHPDSGAVFPGYVRHRW